MGSKKESGPGAPTKKFPIVGLGASAGGLAALESFLAAMPVDSGMGFVVVSHLHPDKPSLMAPLLARRTDMPVVEATAGLAVEPDHIYVAGAGHYLAILDGVLQPRPVPEHTGPAMPIDYFFRSLAKDQKDYAVGVVLSGTGSDGSQGIKEIKAEVGLVVVQDEQSAEYDGMPHSAIATAVVDYVLPVEEIPGRLREHAGLLTGAPEARTVPVSDSALRQVFILIRDTTGHDFSQYKRSTVRRRLERRINLHQLGNVQSYLHYLENHPTEVQTLFKELLIGVTSFFRDGDAWDALAGALEEYLADKPVDYIFRAWVPGCSTGEEAYSIAILVRETCEKLNRPVRAQIFATDLDDKAIDIARAGQYPVNVAGDLTAERLQRFFRAQDGAYQVNKRIREMVVFAPQNLIADPPFTQLDLLSCRNLLIYLEAALQRRLFPIFHYSLNPGGLLLLGSSESASQFAELFSQLDSKTKLYRRKEAALGRHMARFPASAAGPGGPGRHRLPARLAVARPSEVDIAIKRMLLKDLVPPTVLIQEHGEVVHVQGRTGSFLEPAEGAQGTANVFDMARPGLKTSLLAAVKEATSSDDEIVHENVRVRVNDEVVVTNLHAVRLRAPESLQGLIRLTFTPPRRMLRTAPDDSGETVDGAGTRLPELERELVLAKQSHLGTIDELETANEELRSTNEELQSTNEELQSANEELETSKEEMQSLNEELQTVNSELQGKVEELSLANNDLRNLLDGTDIATIFLDDQLRIQRFTEQARQVIRVIRSDIGRFIGDLVSTLHYEDLIDDARDVLRTLAFKEREVRGESGEYYLARILPYRTAENVISGLVLTFIDITQVKKLQAEQGRLVDAIQGSSASVLGQDRRLRYVWACNSLFGKTPAELVGKTDEDLLSREDAAVLTALKQRVIASGRAEQASVTLEVRGSKQVYEFFVQPELDPRGGVVGIQCIAMETTR